jgi:hypothetical protein
LTIFFITGCSGNKQDGEKQETTNKTNVDPLSSWNDGELKHAIITYVKNVGEIKCLFECGATKQMACNKYEERLEGYL